MVRNILILFVLFAVGSDAGCNSTPGTRLTGTIRYFNIRTEVVPRHLIVQIGDEIRWQNLNQHPVLLRMLEDMSLNQAACDKGFSQLGVLQDTVTIAPMQYVSLCFSKPATVRFNIWLDADNPQGAMTPTGSIRIEPSDSSKRSS